MSTVAEGEGAAEKGRFRGYCAYNEPIRSVPSHRVLAPLRDRNAGVSFVRFGLDEEQDILTPHPCEVVIARYVGIESKGCTVDRWLSDACH